MNLRDFVLKHAVRGACTCGKCFDAPEHPEQHQPVGHTADMMFFKVAATEQPSPVEFLKLVKQEAPALLDGKEHGYMEIGGIVGDQGEALMLMGLGSLLGVWELLTPRSVLGKLGLDDKMLMQMAGNGMVTIVRRTT